MKHLWPVQDRLDLVTTRPARQKPVLPRPSLHLGQQKIKRERRRFNVICCGRRFGKNVLLQDLALDTAYEYGQPCAWGAPTYKQLLDDWRVLTDTLAPVTARRNEQEKQIQLTGGGVIDFWSLENADSIRGRKYGRFLVNECGMVPHLLDIWNMVIRPTLIDFQGDAFFGGTPKGMNGFWSLFNMPGAEWARWQMSSYTNPHILPSELDALKLSMSERAFQQEIMGQFLPDGAGVFRNIRAISTLLRAEPLEGHRYVIGRDWGRTNDPSVSSVWDLLARQEVWLEIDQDVPFAIQLSRLKALSERFNNALVVAEQNSLGDPLIEQAAAAGIRIMPFVTTNATKATGVDQLALACERSSGPLFQADEQGILQMEAFEASRTPSGLVKYAAPEGMHDDIPMARLFAYSAIAESGPVILNAE